MRYVRQLLERIGELERANLLLEQDRALLQREVRALRERHGRGGV